MLTFNEIITYEHESEHVLEHNLAHKKYFSAPKIYNANGDLSKRWYVYFSFRNPETGKLERMKNIYGKANTYKTKENRLSILTVYRNRLLLHLKEGYNPFEDNTELYSKKHEVQNTPQIKTYKNNKTPVLEPVIVKTLEQDETPESMPLKEALEEGLKLKQNVVAARTLNDYANRCKNFINWMNVSYPKAKTIDELTKKMVMGFLNDIQIKTSARTRNNYRIDLSAIMQVLEDNEIMKVNFMKKISVLKTKPERHKRYTAKTQEDIFKHLEQNDPILLLYIKFISYNFLRPIEVCRLKIKDINLDNNTIQFKAKNSPHKIKIIPKILRDAMPDISKMNPEHYLFTPTGFGVVWDAIENNRRNNFSKRFKKNVKDHFNLENDYTLYSFRHTYITKLYRQLEKEYAPHEAKSKLMQITGHATMESLEKYLRNINAQLPEDYSELLK